jgi:N-acetylglucosaminyldiphosphoundecaprenol N-acetyl-beta-D-mannosaminyltransferase
MMIQEAKLNSSRGRHGATVAGVRVDATSYSDVIENVTHWIGDERAHYIVAANTHSIVEASRSDALRSMINDADLVLPDGRPLVWCLSKAGFKGQESTRGPETMLELMRHGEPLGWRFGFYGSTPEVLDQLSSKMRSRFPKIDLAYIHSPPFRSLTESEAEEVRRQVHLSNVDILFVGLGCPSQEKWMALESKSLRCTMVGVGAAFSFHAGLVPRAPAPLQKAGLEWAFRLTKEPKRLWRRYARVVPRFIYLALKPKAIQRI